MKISDLEFKLKQYRTQLGDLPVYTMLGLNYDELSNLDIHAIEDNRSKRPKGLYICHTMRDVIGKKRNG